MVIQFYAFLIDGQVSANLALCGTDVLEKDGPLCLRAVITGVTANRRYAKASTTAALTMGLQEAFTHQCLVYFISEREVICLGVAMRKISYAPTLDEVLILSGMWHCIVDSGS